MSEWIKLTEYNWAFWIAGLFALIEFIKWLWSAGEWIVSKFGIETKGMRQKREQSELLVKTAENLAELQKKHNNDNNECLRHDDEIRADLKKLTDMFINKEINDYRWEIINFATKVSEGKPCNKDSYKHCFKTYSDYEQLLEENNLENGEVEISMEIIREGYKKKMTEGF